MTASLVEELTDAGEIRAFAADDVLCTEGELSTAAFVVVDGALEACIDVGDELVVVGRHEPGAVVGEVTALVGGRRTATLRASEPTRVSVVQAPQLREVIDRHPDEASALLEQARERTDRSRAATLLARELHTNDADVIAQITERATWLHLDAGDLLFADGDHADSAYLVLSGRLSVTRPGGSRRPDVGRGGIVGEFGLLEDRPRTATVRALRDSSLARLSSVDFASLTAKQPGVAMGLVRRIVERSGEEYGGGISTGRSACVVVTAPTDTRILTSQMQGALDEIGSTAHLSAGRVDAMLGHAGASAIAPGGVGDVRLIELLHQVDADHAHVVLEGHLDHPVWTRRALRHADQIVVICSAEPDAAEAAVIEDLVAQMPSQTPFWIAALHARGVERPQNTPELRGRFGATEVHHIRQGNVGDVQRVARLAVGEGFGLVLSGGGARGFAHLGVIAAFEEQGVPFDRICGASMGSVIAAVVAQGLAPAERVTVVQRQFHDLLDYTLPVVSLVKGERITAAIQDQLGGYDIEDLWIPFSCVTTNLTTSEVVPHRTGPLDLAVRGSVAIPGVLPPVPHEGDLLIDGGVLNNLPVDLVCDDPSIGTVIAVDVTPPRGPRAKADYGLSVSGWKALRSQLSRTKGKTQYPGVVSVLMRTMLIGSARDRDRMLESGVVDFHLDLELAGVSLLDFETVEPVAARGHEAAIQRIETWWMQHCTHRELGRLPDHPTGSADK